jgi:hypothetical protein
VLWILLTWLGLSYTDGWIWSIVMLGMPLAMFFGAKVLDSQRKKIDEQALASTR